MAISQEQFAEIPLSRFRQWHGYLALVCSLLLLLSSWQVASAYASGAALAYLWLWSMEVTLPSKSSTASKPAATLHAWLIGGSLLRMVMLASAILLLAASDASRLLIVILGFLSYKIAMLLCLALNKQSNLTGNVTSGS